MTVSIRVDGWRIDVECSKKSTYQCRLARSLHAIESKEEGRRFLVATAMLLPVQLQPLQNEGNAVLRLVINDFWHFDRVWC